MHEICRGVIPWFDLSASRILNLESGICNRRYPFGCTIYWCMFTVASVLFQRPARHTCCGRRATHVACECTVFDNLLEQVPSSTHTSSSHCMHFVMHMRCIHILQSLCVDFVTALRHRIEESCISRCHILLILTVHCVIVLHKRAYCVARVSLYRVIAQSNSHFVVRASSMCICMRHWWKPINLLTFQHT